MNPRATRALTSSSRSREVCQNFFNFLSLRLGAFGHRRRAHHRARTMQCRRLSLPGSSSPVRYTRCTVLIVPPSATFPFWPTGVMSFRIGSFLDHWLKRPPNQRLRAKTYRDYDARYGEGGSRVDGARSHRMRSVQRDKKREILSVNPCQ